MKKKVLLILGVTAFAVTVALHISTNTSNQAKIDVTLANAEALAGGEVELGRGCILNIYDICVWYDDDGNWDYAARGEWAS